MSNHPTTVLGTEPAACRSCGAPLASDQRYCLACGTRVSAPRLDFLAELEAGRAADAAAASTALVPAGAAATAGGPPPPPPPPPSRLDKIGGPMGAAAVVLVALGIGFLIGESGNDPAPVAQRAPVVNIQGGVGGTAPAAGAGDATGTAPPAADDAATGAGGGRARGGARDAAADAARVQESVRDIPSVEDVPDDAGGDLERLREQPLEQSTGSGPVLRRDNRAAGGGSEAESIG